MFEHFVNVLVPVRLHSEDDKSINIAIHLADPRFCVIHLLDIVKPTILSFVCGGRVAAADMLQLGKLKTTIEQCRPNSVVKVHICKSSNFSEVIARYANRLYAQVIVMPEMEGRGYLSLEDIAGRTHCKILAYRDGILSSGPGRSDA